MSLLPHRGRMLLLDRVLLNSERVIGELSVTEELCEGHEVLQGKAVLRGLDICEMAAQLLGTWALSQFPEVRPKQTVFRELERAKFMDVIFPGELLTLELEIQNIKIRDARRLGKIIIGEKFSAKVRDKLKCTIDSVKLVVS